MIEVPVVPRSHAAVLEVARAPDMERYEGLLDRLRPRLAGSTVWHINSTAEGGGVSELLRSTLGYLDEGGIETRWLVFDGDPAFFTITKRLHNRLHGDLGDGGPLGSEERRQYDDVTARNLEAAETMVGRGDIVVVHDPQPLGLVPGLAARGALPIWTCHVGVDQPNDMCRSAWSFLRPYLEGARAATFTRRAYVWEGLARIPVELIPPCIDAFSLKNIDLSLDQREGILRAARLLETSHPGTPAFPRDDGTPAQVTHAADVDEDAPVPADATLVVQVSRWDRLKDPIGVLHGFIEDPDISYAHLMLAGPKPSSVADDPEAEAVIAEMHDVRRALATDERSRVHLANLPTDDVEENAVIVNALQRRADVVVQKSLAEGFGLTVTEAMWKQRPLVASRVGGIQDQITDGEQGLLVDPRNLTEFGNAVQAVLDDPEMARALGYAARERVREQYLAPQYLSAYLALFEQILA
jgi:trehalose synthase